MDNLTSQGDLATRIRVAAGEAGILPGDALAPVLEALAEIPAEVRQSLAPLVQQIEAVKRPVDDDKLRYAVAQGIHGHAATLIREFRLRTSLAIAGLLLAVLLVGVGGGYWFGRRSAAEEYVQTPAALGVALTNQQAEKWLNLIRLNNISDATRNCWNQSGGTACSIAVWVKPPTATAN